MFSSTILEVYFHFLAMPLFVAQLMCTILAYLFSYCFHTHTIIVMQYLFHYESVLFFAGLLPSICLLYE
jgi:hypothetical protein